MPDRVLIVDDHMSFRQLARRLLEHSGYLVVGEAATAAEAVRVARNLAPDVVLLDIQLPDLDGFAVAISLRELPSPPAVVLISSRDSADYGPRVQECGAMAFIAKADLTVDSFRAALNR